MIWLRAVAFLLLCIFTPVISAAGDALLGLPPLLIPVDRMQTPEKVALGKKLFFDKRLSADGTISCAACHDENKAFTDGLVVAEGIRKQKGTRITWWWLQL